jgi:hypothetical protein
MNFLRQSDKRRRRAALFTVALLAAATAAVAFGGADTTARPAPLTGIFTGEIASGGPVYRLPPIHVVARRSAELARIERDEHIGRTRAEEAKADRKPNA